MPDCILNRLFELSKNPIHELEVLPVLLAANLWSVYLAKAQTVWYIDNESARMAMIRGAGETTYSSKFISEFVAVECREQIKSWFARSILFKHCRWGLEIRLPAAIVLGCCANHFGVGEHRAPHGWIGECCGRLNRISPHCIVKKGA